MPRYDYRCLHCRKAFDIFLTYGQYGKDKVSCPHCQSDNVQRKIGRIRFARSSESHLESMADPNALAGLEDDPRALGRMMRQMSSELGEDMGSEFNDVVTRLESGQSPDQIEKDLPDLADDLGGGVGGGDFGLDDF